ncbi:hypothetical protein [Euzebya rosea]|uniref:hypothetical protein n=1 Tax=Euzebya rosea TaxID=2052804 RepID=UPI000D3E355B|nr:hypothetical protein [Euzebya rosea]
MIDRPSPRARGLHRHRTDVVSLLFGVAFTAAALSALVQPGEPGRIDVGAVAAVAAVVAGLAVIFSLRRSSRDDVVEDAATDIPFDPALPPAPIIPTPEAIRDEDREWFGLDNPLSEVEREILASLEEEDRSTSGTDAPDEGPPASPSGGEPTPDGPTG